MATLLHFCANAFIVMTAIGIHYDILNGLYHGMPRLPLRPRSRVVIGVIGAVIAHTLEVFVFAVGYMLTDWWGYGSFRGEFTGTLSDYIYFSYSAFTTVGFGDIVPRGGMRWLAGIEALTGFVLITWTASFLYLEMLRNWEHD